MINLPPIHSRKFLDWVSKGISRENILTWLGDEDAIFRWHAKYNDAIEEIAKETGTPMVDIRSEFLTLPDYSQLLCDDGMHLNEKGHSLVCKMLTAYAREQQAKE